MRWSIIHLIWFRELRDQLRDRRTVFMIVVLPIVLYPLFGMGLMQLALGFLKQRSTVGVYNSTALPRPTPRIPGSAPLSASAWLGSLPVAPATAADWLSSTLALAEASQTSLEYPPLLVASNKTGKPVFVASYFDKPEEAETLPVLDLGRLKDFSEVATVLEHGMANSTAEFLDPLKNKEVDLLLIVPPDFQERLERGERPVVTILAREGDDHSRSVAVRVATALTGWKKKIKEVRLLRRGLPADFDDVVGTRDPEVDRRATERAAKGLFDLMGRIFPIMLVMWSLAGALYPAVDLCAGEKERGTMETLLISPVSREEIVYGKFLAIWVFSGATALFHLLSMCFTAWQFSSKLPEAVLRPSAVFWCVLLVLPLSAFFSALCLAVGAYARSSKEGQYYLMPLFLITMPLIFLTLVPGIELNPFYSLVPVTGVALLLHQLMADASRGLTLLYFVPVLAPMVLYGWLALRWAVMQFQREEVLFREAERLDVGLWFRRLFRDKEALPSAGQALFCFGLILVLRWLTIGFGAGLSLMARTGIDYLAFVLVPTVFMALMLTTRPGRGLGLRWPPPSSWLLAAVLAVLLLFPLAELAGYVLHQFPNVQKLIKEGNPLTTELQALRDPNEGLAPWLPFLFVLGVLAAVCEELAFRGFILTGLRRRFKPWTAILLSSFLFAVYHANVFQFLPAFVLGVVLALFATRTGSVLPGMLFHMLHNSLLIGVEWFETRYASPGGEVEGPSLLIRLVVVVLCTLLAAALLWRLWARDYGGLSLALEVAGDRAETNGELKRTTATEARADKLVP